MDRIETLHKELSFSTYAPRLKKISGYWNRLVALQLKAKRNVKYLAEYRQFIERGIAQAKAASELTDDSFYQALLNYNAFYEAKRTEHRIAEIEGRRYPPYLESWTERHLPKTWKGYMTALARVTEAGSEQSFEQLKSATVKMIENFIDREDR